MDTLIYINLGFIIFVIGLVGIIFNRKNVLIILMSIELLLLSINFNFVMFSIYLDDIMGQVFSLYILIVAAAESAIGLAILVIYFRLRNSIAINYFYILRG